MARTKKRQQATRRKAPRSAMKSNFNVVNISNIAWKKLALVVLVVLPVIAFIGGYQWIQDPQNMTIKSVEIKGGLKILDKTALQPVIEPYTRTNLYLLNTSALEKAIESNSWVRSASMTKVWPDKLIVKIVEQTPVAFWGKKEMLAENGAIIKASLNKKDVELPMLFSPNDKGRNMAKGFLKIRNWMKGFPLKMVEFKEDMRGSWQIKLENGMTLKIGRDQQEKRLRRFMVGYKQSLIEVIDKISVVDLRYTNGFAVKWKKGLSSDSIFKG